jgi:hypothetical protein
LKTVVARDFEAVYRAKMGASATSVTAGVIKLAAAALLPVALLYLIVHFGKVTRTTLRVLRWCRLVPKPKPGPPPPRVPLEKITADLCRLTTALRDVPPEASRARKHGLLLAYDDVLGKAALALDVPAALDELPLGMDRDLERIRVESDLRDAGLLFGPRKRQDTP